MNFLRLAVAVDAALVSGCRIGDATDSYALTSVAGTVTLDGKPLGEARIMFTPQGNDPDTSGSDVTVKEGDINIMYRGRSRVARKKSSVLVSKVLDGLATESPSDDSGAFSEDAVPAAMKKQRELTAASVVKRAKKSRPLIVTQTFDHEVGDNAEALTSISKNLESMSRPPRIRHESNGADPGSGPRRAPEPVEATTPSRAVGTPMPRPL